MPRATLRFHPVRAARFVFLPPLQDPSHSPLGPLAPALTGLEVLLPVLLLDLAGRAVPRPHDALLRLGRIQDVGPEAARLNDGHLHPEIQELAPGRQQ